MTAAQRRRLGLILVIVGPAMMLIGVVGLFLDGDDPSGSGTSTVGTEAPEAGTEAPEAGTETTTSASPTDPGSEPVGSPVAVLTGSDVRVFVAEFAAAIRGGDGAFLFGRLHPAVLERYGVEQCRRQIGDIRDETHMIEVVEIREPGPWDYVTDGVVTTIEDALAVSVRRSSQDQQAEQDIHVAPHEGQVRWFTDCGDP